MIFLQDSRDAFWVERSQSVDFQDALMTITMHFDILVTLKPYKERRRMFTLVQDGVRLNTALDPVLQYIEHIKVRIVE